MERQVLPLGLRLTLAQPGRFSGWRMSGADNIQWTDTAERVRLLRKLQDPKRSTANDRKDNHTDYQIRYPGIRHHNKQTRHDHTQIHDNII